MNKNLKEKILELRQKGYTYNQIVGELKCSKSTVSYHCNTNSKNVCKKRYYKDHWKTKVYKKLEHFFNDKQTGEYNIKITRDVRARISSKIHTFSRKNRGNHRMFSVQDFIDKVGPNPTCYLTGEPINIEDTNSWNLDHIIPLSRGGSCDIENMGLITKRANDMKSYHTLEELEELCKKVLTIRGYTILDNH